MDSEQERDRDRDRDRERRRASRKSNAGGGGGSHSNGRGAGSAAESPRDSPDEVVGGIVLHEGDVLSGRWCVGAKVGEGTFSRIYDATPAAAAYGATVPPSSLPHACVVKVNKKAPRAASASSPYASPVPPTTDDESFAYEALVFRSVQAAEEKGAAAAAAAFGVAAPYASPVPLSVPRLLDHQSFAMVMHPTGSSGSGGSVLAPCPSAPSGVEYMVLEKCGVDLSRLRYDWQARVGQQPPVAIQLACMCLTALERFHSAGYIHRDIKPSNFLTCLDPAQAAQRVLITDFGLSRRRDAPPLVAPPGHTHAPDNKFIGKSLYASFAAHRHESQGARDDVASLLFVMLDLMFGSLPWKAAADKRTMSQQQRWNLVLAEKERLLGPEVCRAAHAARQQQQGATGEGVPPPPSNEWLPGYPLPPQLRFIFHELHSGTPSGPVDYAGIRAQLQQLHGELHGQMTSGGKSCVSLVDLLQRHAEEARKQAVLDAQRREDQVADERRAMQKQLAEEQAVRDAEKFLKHQAEHRAQMAAKAAQAAAAAAQAAQQQQQQWQPVPSHAQPTQLGLLPMPRSAQQMFQDKNARDKAAREGAAAAASLRGPLTARPPPYVSWPRRLRDLFGQLFGLHSDVHVINLADGLPAPVAPHSLEALWDSVKWSDATQAAASQKRLLRAQFNYWTGDWQHVYDGLVDLRFAELQGLAAYCTATPSVLPAQLAASQLDQGMLQIGLAVNIAFLYELVQRARKGAIHINNISTGMSGAAAAAARPTPASGTAAAAAPGSKSKIRRKVGADGLPVVVMDGSATPHADIATAPSASPPAAASSASSAAAASAAGLKQKEREKEKEKDSQSAASASKKTVKDSISAKKEGTAVKKEPAVTVAKKETTKDASPALKPKSAAAAVAMPALSSASVAAAKLESKVGAMKLEEKKAVPSGADKKHVAAGSGAAAAASATAAAAAIKDRKPLVAASTSDKRPLQPVQGLKAKLKAKALLASSSDDSSSSSGGSSSDDSSSSDDDSDDGLLLVAKPAQPKPTTATAAAASAASTPASGSKPSRPSSSADSSEKKTKKRKDDDSNTKASEKAAKEKERTARKQAAKQARKVKEEERKARRKKKKADEGDSSSEDEEEEDEEEEEGDDAEAEKGEEEEEATPAPKSKRQLEAEAKRQADRLKAETALAEVVGENFTVAAHNFLLGGPLRALLQKPEEFVLPAAVLAAPPTAEEIAAARAAKDAARAAAERLSDPHYDPSRKYVNINAGGATGETRKSKKRKGAAGKAAEQQEEEGGEEESDAEDAGQAERAKAEKAEKAAKAKAEREAKKAAVAAKREEEAAKRAASATTRPTRRSNVFLNNDAALRVTVSLNLPPKHEQQTEGGADAGADATTAAPASGLSIDPHAAGASGAAGVDGAAVQSPLVTPGGRKRGRPPKAKPMSTPTPQESGSKRPKRGATPTPVQANANPDATGTTPGAEADATVTAAAPATAPAVAPADSAAPAPSSALPPVPEAGAGEAKPDAAPTAAAADSQSAAGAKRKLDTDQTEGASTTAPDLPASKKQK